MSETANQPASKPRYEVGVVDGVAQDDGVLLSVAAHLPTAVFRRVSLETTPRELAGLDALIAPGSMGQRIDAVLASTAGDVAVVVVLEDFGVTNSRRLLNLGAADVLAAPITDSTLTLSLERIMRASPVAPARPRSSGSVVAIMKAGGGVGASFLASQAATRLARQDGGPVAIVDLDIQYGLISEYLDAGQSFTVADVIGNAAAFSETGLTSALVEHASGCRILGAPKDVMPLESITNAHVETMISGLRKTFATTLVDLPSDWTQWSFRTLQLADRVVLVTQLSVPHMQVVKRQLRVLAAQKLDQKPIHLIINGASADQLASLPLKAAEKAIGRTFDLVIPEDRRTANLATNQGVEVHDARPGSKLDTAIGQLAAMVTTGDPVANASSGFKIKFW